MIQSSEAMIYVPELNSSAVTCMSYNNHNEHTSTRVAYTQYTLLMQAHAFAHVVKSVTLHKRCTRKKVKFHSVFY